jgi:tartrate dehydrogenase/decarboxylase/D-malate dehydrogenase
MSSIKIAVIPGDGIGKEVIPEGIRALEAAGSGYGVDFAWTEFDWSCETYHKTGRMMPEDGIDQLGDFDAIYLGAVGFPGVPDHISLWGLLIPIRRAFDQYVNLRPVRLFDGVPCPLAGKKPGDIDFYVVRENVEGEYSSVGGIQYEGTEHEVVSQVSLFTRRGTDRILRYAFELAQSRPAGHLSSATKSNGIFHSMPYWDRRVKAIAASYPQVTVDQYHIDILTANFVRMPEHFDVVVGFQPVWRYSLRSGPRLRRHHRHRPLGKHQPRADLPVDVRTGARLRPRYCRPGNRQPHRYNLGRCDDDAASGLSHDT